MIAVWSDYAIPTELDKVRITVAGPTETRLTDFPLTTANEANKTKLPVVLMIARADNTAVSVDVEATGLKGTDALVSQKAQLAFVPGETRVLTLHLDRDCAGRDCPQSYTCAAGSCDQRIVVTATDLPVFIDPQHLPDAGFDRPRDDGGFDSADSLDEPSATDGAPADSGADQSLLTITKAGSGSGAVKSNPSGIDCGADCEHAFDTGATVVLTATPDTSSSFTGWSGGGCSGTGTCTVSLTAATTVSATFTLNQYALIVQKLGSGSGKVKSSPAGIDCGTVCSQTFNHGTSVVLTATPDTTSSFKGWSGGGCSGTGTCTVSLTAATTVTATFTLNQYALTVTKPGNGSGTVTSSPGAMTCGTTCSQAFNYGTSVVLTASADTGSSFAGWSGGGCSGTGTCTVSVTAATTVSATFTLNQYALTVTKSGNGSGKVTSSPGAIACGTTCSQAFNYGTSVVLTASADAGSSFRGWSGGGCSGTGTCTVSVTAATTVSAHFFGCTLGTGGGCLNGTIAAVDLGTGLTAAQCHDQCQSGMVTSGWTSGCWLIAMTGSCFCRSGALQAGTSFSGGACE